MKKLYFLDESEKERILNMHTSATKKHYLIEGKSNVLKNYFLMEDDIETTMTTIDPKSTVDISVADLQQQYDTNIPADKQDSGWSVPFLTIVGVAVGVAGYAILPGRMKQRIRDAFEYLRKGLRKANEPFYPRYKKAIQETVSAMQQEKIMTDDGRIYVIIDSEEVMDLTGKKKIRYFFEEFNLKTYFEGHLNRLIKGDFDQPKELYTTSEADFEKVAKIQGKPLLSGDMIDAKQFEGDKGKYVEVSTDPITGEKMSENAVAGELEVPIKKYDSGITIYKKSNDVKSDFSTKKLAARRAFGTVMTILGLGGSLSLAAYHTAVLAWFTSVFALKNNVPLLMDLFKSEDPEAWVNKLCQIELWEKEVKVYADPNKFKNDIITILNKKNYSDLGKMLENRDIRDILELQNQGHEAFIPIKNKNIIYSKTSSAGCFFQFMLDSMGEEKFKTYVINKIKKPLEKAINIQTDLMNLRTFWEAVKKSNYTDGMFGTTLKMSEFVNFEADKTSFMKNCPCKLFETIKQWAISEKPIYPIVVISKSKESVIMFTDKTDMITSRCNKFNYSDFVFHANDVIQGNPTNKTKDKNGYTPSEEWINTQVYSEIKSDACS